MHLNRGEVGECRRATQPKALRSDWLLASSLVELFRCVFVLLNQSAAGDPKVTADLQP